ncbi:MAG: hypothetical protein OQJ78_04480 [Ignavibacteriaceae bacterium]|nr:hypothetical protein [Ignavibacteriaceae bacterium]
MINLCSIQFLRTSTTMFELKDSSLGTARKKEVYDGQLDGKEHIMHNGDIVELNL